MTNLDRMQLGTGRGPLAARTVDAAELGLWYQPHIVLSERQLEGVVSGAFALIHHEHQST